MLNPCRIFCPTSLLRTCAEGPSAFLYCIIVLLLFEQEFSFSGPLMWCGPMQLCRPEFPRAVPAFRERATQRLKRVWVGQTENEALCCVGKHRVLLLLRYTNRLITNILRWLEPICWLRGPITWWQWLERRGSNQPCVWRSLRRCVYLAAQGTVIPRTARCIIRLLDRCYLDGCGLHLKSSSSSFPLGEVPEVYAYRSRFPFVNHVHEKWVVVEVRWVAPHVG